MRIVLKMRLFLLAFVACFCAPVHAAVFPPYLTWSEDPATTVTISWRRDVAGLGTVDYGLTSAYGETATDQGGATKHEVTLRGLTPGTEYHYRVTSSDGYVSADSTFWTAPSSTSPVRFLVYGDTRTGEVDHRRVVARMDAQQAPFYLHVGDLVADGREMNLWTNFFDIEKNMIRRSVFMPIAGNHEDIWAPSTLFWDVFSLPQSPAAEQYYSFDAGNVHFIGLNSEIKVGGAQRNWLQSDLQSAVNNTDITWVVAFFHNPPYSAGAHGSDWDIRAEWCPLFEQYGVDLVFNGHDHNYERTIPVNGVQYIVTGGGGAPLRAVGSDAYTAVSSSCYHFVSLSITGDVVSFIAIRDDGVEFDQRVWTNQNRRVRFYPNRPVRGSTVRVRYDASRSTLAAADPVYVSIGIDNWSAVSDQVMTRNLELGVWEYNYTIPLQATERGICTFRNGGSTITDNNYSKGWQLLIHDSVPGTEALLPVSGSYDGNAVSDLAIYEKGIGDWFIRALGDPNLPAITYAQNWGGQGLGPVPGDYDGDGVSDLSVYEYSTGSWFIQSLLHLHEPPIAFAQNWGSAAMQPVSGDYNGDGVYDLAAYETLSGNWYVRSLGNAGDPPICFGQNWGGAGLDPVSGDYNGDGVYDLAVCQESTGSWYIRSLGDLSMDPITFGQNWGGLGLDPVPGDYNGDGLFDLAVYQESTGNWYIRSLGTGGGPPICFGQNWGGPGLEPVSGDFNGDGVYDLAVYETATGRWYIRSLGDLSDPPIVFGQQWGW